MSEAFFLKNLLGKPIIRLSNSASRENQRKTALSVGGILLVLLAITVGFGSWKRIHTKQEAQIALVEERVRYAIGEAQRLSSLQPSRARDLLREEKQRVDAETEQTTDTAVKSKLQEFSSQVLGAMDTAGRVVRVNPELYLDLSLIREHAQGSALSVAGDQLVILDAQNGVVLAISQQDRSGNVVAGGDLFHNATSISSTPDDAYVLAGKTVVKTPLKESAEASKIVIEDTEGLIDPVAVGIFADSVYVLDRAVSDIFKYPLTDEGFGSRRRWFEPGLIPDLVDAIDMEIDGDVWVVLKNGQVGRYRRGTAVEFLIHGEDLPLDPAALSIPAGASRVWILDRGGKRVIAFDRASGEYVGQWVSDIFVDANGLVVNETTSKAFVLVKEKLYVLGVE